MKKLIALALLSPFAVFAQPESYADSTERARRDHDSTFAADVLSEAEREHFKGLCYYPLDEKYVVQAKFTPEKGRKFAMPMTKQREQEAYYRKAGRLTFELDGKSCELFVYESLSLKKRKGFKDYLFLPFRDATSGEGSYGGGRFIDLKRPAGNTITVDFNSCYNPYCAYSERYSCPVTPAENRIPVAVRAGACYEGHE
jgi:uncharacterized protein